jgi:hypothetical protein
MWVTDVPSGMSPGGTVCEELSSADTFPASQACASWMPRATLSTLPTTCALEDRVSGMHRSLQILHSSSGALCARTPRAAVRHPSHDMHALEDLSVSGCDQLARDFTRQQRRVCVSWTPQQRQPSPDMRVGGPECQWLHLSSQTSCTAAAERAGASRSYLTTLP